MQKTFGEIPIKGHFLWRDQECIKCGEILGGEGNAVAFRRGNPTRLVWFGDAAIVEEIPDERPSSEEPRPI